MKTIIAITGYKGSGKTTAAMELMKIGFTRIRFAQGLKSMLLGLGLTEAQVDGAFKETPSPLLGGKTPRFAMQTLGTQWGRDIISPNLWINDWRRRVKETPNHIPIVVDDLRFPNEQEAVVDLGGNIILVKRTGCEATAHSSEDLDHIVPDYVIQNDGTMDAFVAQVRELDFARKKG